MLSAVDLNLENAKLSTFWDLNFMPKPPGNHGYCHGGTTR